jgi:hypothetical protein
LLSEYESTNKNINQLKRSLDPRLPQDYDDISKIIVVGTIGSTLGVIPSLDQSFPYIITPITHVPSNALV